MDAYLYWDAGELRLGVTTFEASTRLTFSAPESSTIDAILGPDSDLKIVNAVELFDTEMYVGGAVGDVAADATAFGCRDWNFACAITGVWPRDQNDTEIARAIVRWVYSVVEDLLPLSRGAYGADLGPDPRDVALAAKAFGANLPRLKRLKRCFDPQNVLAYACPVQKASLGPKLVILVTGKSGVGKDYCANIWVSVFSHHDCKVRAVSISDATKREYAASTGADLDLLLSDRAYKEEHRPALSVYFQEQTRQRPQLPVEHFQNVVYENSDVDVLFITGMRDVAPVANFSHLVPESRILDVHVQVSEQLRRTRRELHSHEDDRDVSDSENSNLEYRPNFVFNNNITRDVVVKSFAARYLLPFVHEDLQQLTRMVPRVLHFPRPGTEFRDVLGISKKRGGLALATSLLQSHFTRDWSKVDAVVTCETGGIVFASPLATQADVPLVIMRDAGKFPPPALSITKSSPYITSLSANDSKEKCIEMEQSAVRPGSSVVVVDGVLSTGKTLCAVLQLL